MTKTLAQNKYIDFFIMPQIGRFFPLDAFDLNIIYYFFGLNAKAFYFFSALGALVLIFALVRALNLTLDSKNLALFLVFALLITPAFATAFLRLFVPEKFESVFFALFILCFVLFLRKQRAFYFICALIAANIALYYKEPAFIMLGTFAFFHFIFSIKTSSRAQKILDILLMLSCALWIAMYYINVIALKTTQGRYGDTPHNAALIAAKNLINYSISEPFLFIGIPLIVAWRALLLARKKAKIHPFFDACLLAAFMHNLTYIALNIYSFHYPLPAYIFALFGLGYMAKNYFSRFIKILFIFCGLIYALNGFFAFIYQFNHYKSVPPNFSATIEFLDSYLRENPRTNIYLEGVNRASQTEVWTSFAEYLELLGHEDFDLRSDTGIDNVLLGKENPHAKYSVKKSNAIIPKQSGDLVVFTPYSSFGLNDKFLESKSYELLFKSEFGLNLPFLGIKALIKALAPSHLQVAHNTFALPIHFSVYKVQ